MMWRVYKVRLLDEIPGVGAGERLVEAQVGRKFAYVRRHPPLVNRRHRVLRSTWDRLDPKEVT